MTDVAASAGVSYQTVSRVLNAPHLVRPDTRERVQRAIRELGFTPNRAARALRTTRTGTLGVIAPASPLFGPSATVHGIEEAARAAGYATLLTTVDERHGEGGRAGAEMIGHGVDGIIVVAPYEALMSPIALLAARIPVVSVNAGAHAGTGRQDDDPREEAPSGRSGASGVSVDGGGVGIVAVDQARGARDLVAHLARTGRRRILHLPGPEAWFDARERVRGVQQGAREHRLDLRIAPPSPWTAEAGYRAGRRLLEEARSAGLPDAIMAANDHLALGVLSALAEAGLEVPTHIAVTGFDDVEGAAFFRPALTTVRQPFAELGSAAVGRLLEAAGGGEEADEGDSVGPSLLTPTLVLRESA